MDDFEANPSWETFDKLIIKDLVKLAEKHEINVDKKARKAELQRVVGAGLLAKGLLQPRAPDDDAQAAEPEVAGVAEGRPHEVLDFQAFMPAENLRLTLRIKEEETRQKGLEVEALRLKIIDKEIRLKELEVETLRLQLEAFKLKKESPAEENAED